MTNIVEGVLIDVLHLLEKKYNFSTQLYKRKDGAWGLAELLQNGTYRGGIIQRNTTKNGIMIYEKSDCFCNLHSQN